MKKILAAFLLPLFILSIFGCSKKDESPAPSSGDADYSAYNALATQFVGLMASGDFDAAVEMLDGTMKSLVSASALESDVWSIVIGQAGEFVSVENIENSLADEYLICFTTSRHEKTGVTLRIVFSKDKLIAGLFIDGYPELSAMPSSEPSIEQQEGFTDFAVVIGENTDYPLDGILSIPDGVEKPPAVVLVHGSGPNDMDETIFENKPFRDIAEYLAANGIAVLRYNKRTYAYGEKFVQTLGDATVKDETIDDAILAAQLLKADPRIDENRVFILGHSLGGMLAARIHSDGGDFAGLILLAGSPRSLLDISYDQQVAFVDAMPDGDEKSAALAQLETYDEQIAALMALSDEDAKSTPMSGGASFYYFKEMEAHPSADYLKDIDVPIFALQGSADFQVLADKDFALYQELLGDRANATLKLYDGLNHLFMPSSGAGITEYQEEYKVAGHVDNQVLQDIADWIKAN